MHEYPQRDVERIINEEIMRGHGTTLWTKPQARRRYQKLIAGRIVGADNGRMLLLEQVFDAQYELIPYCTDRERIFAFPSDAMHRLRTLLRQLRDVLTAVLDAREVWPPDARLDHDDGEAFLTMQVQQLQDELERAQRAHADGGTIGLHSGRSVVLDQALQVCRYLLLTASESVAFDEHYGRAQQQLRQAGPLFNMPPDPTLQ